MADPLYRSPIGLYRKQTIGVNNSGPRKVKMERNAGNFGREFWGLGVIFFCWGGGKG